jgi:hypothetical protein
VSPLGTSSDDICPSDHYKSETVRTQRVLGAHLGGEFAKFRSLGVSYAADDEHYVLLVVASAVNVMVERAIINYHQLMERRLDGRRRPGPRERLRLKRRS